MIDLVFDRLRNSAHPVDIVFGEPAGPIVDASGVLDIALPGIAPSFEGSLDYDLAVSGSDVIGTASTWQPGAAVITPSLTARHAAGAPAGATHRVPWGRGLHVVSDRISAWQQLDSMLAGVRPGWQAGEPVRIAGSSSAWQSSVPLPCTRRSPWQSGIPTRTGAAGGWSVAAILPARPRALPWGAARPTPVRVQTSAQSGAPVWQRPMRIRWTCTEPLPAGRSVITLPPVEPPWRCYTPPLAGDVHLLFDTRSTSGFEILFSCGSSTPSGPRVVPILECYIVINAVSLVRADNGAEIPADALQLGIGSDGPHWTWSASLPGYARSLVADRPEVIATLNGTPVRLVVERVRRDRRASLRGTSDALQISGRSPSAWLSNPFAAVRARTNENPYTAQQLAADALTINGVPMGWALDWRLPDWLVPAGAWSHHGTHMEAVLRIAEAGGGYIQAAAATQTLRALPHYPAAPWLWASLTPDLLLPEDVVEVEGSETAGGAGYDVVYVEGIGPAGRRDRVRRTGTAGVLPAPQIIDPLATDPDMTRARGLAALAASGPQTRVTLRLPVLQETGLILPGTLLDYAAEGATRRGIVRSFQADWTHPELWQSVEVECHG